jgi:uncharacterized protein YbjT (DUF2867 family)
VSTVAIAGGHGKIAMLLGRALAERGDTVRGLIRDPDQEDDLRAAGIDPVLCDLEGDGDVGAAVRGADAVVFAAGAGPGSGDARKATMDRGGAVKLIEAAKAEGVSRYLIVSSMGADRAPDDGAEGFGAYQRAKFEADEALRASGLDYTVVRPGGLTDDPATGRVTIAADTGAAGSPAPTSRRSSSPAWTSPPRSARASTWSAAPPRSPTPSPRSDVDGPKTRQIVRFSPIDMDSAGGVAAAAADAGREEVQGDALVAGADGRLEDAAAAEAFAARLHPQFEAQVQSLGAVAEDGRAVPVGEAAARLTDVQERREDRAAGAGFHREVPDPGAAAAAGFDDEGRPGLAGARLARCHRRFEGRRRGGDEEGEHAAGDGDRHEH